MAAFGTVAQNIFAGPVQISGIGGKKLPEINREIGS